MIIHKQQSKSKPKCNLSDSSSSSDEHQSPPQKMKNDDENEDREWYYKPCNWIKLNIIFFLIALLISGLSQPKMLWNLLQIFLKWMESHIVKGSFVFISLYMIADLLMAPCLIFTLGAGFVYCNVLHSTIYGLICAVFMCAISELIASTFAFLIARYLLRKTIKKIAAKYPKFVLIDAAVKKHGFKVTLLFRMSPVTPYNLLNYFMGLTSVRFMDYTMASVGILPNFFVCCLVGSSIHHIYQLSQIDVLSNIPLLCVTIAGIVSIICLIFYGTKAIRKELKKISMQMKQEQDLELTTDYNDEHARLTEHDAMALDRCEEFGLSIDEIANIELMSNIS